MDGKKRVINVYTKDGIRIAEFANTTSIFNVDSQKDIMVAPTIHSISNGESTLSFQMLASSKKWGQIKDPENIYECNGKLYTALNENSIVYNGEVVDVTLVETWYLLKKVYLQAHNVNKKVEALDEHTVKILPKTDPKYKLTVNGKTYEDSEVKDARGVLMPRGSAGYALWAILKGTDWKLGVCDVLPDGFNAKEDYGTFNVESDMKSALENIQFIQELYGGILVWDSMNKTVHLRDERKESDFNEWKGYSVRKDKNLAEAPKITWDNNIITRLYPLGNGNLNIKLANGGSKYYFYENGVLVTSAWLNGLYFDKDGILDSKKEDKHWQKGKGEIWYEDSAGNRLTGWQIIEGNKYHFSNKGYADIGWSKIDDKQYYFYKNGVMAKGCWIKKKYLNADGTYNPDEDKSKSGWKQDEKTHDYYYEVGGSRVTGWQTIEGNRYHFDNSGKLDLGTKTFGGKTYIENFSYTKKVYEGYIQNPNIYDTRDAGGQKTLKFWAEQQLEKMCRPRKSIEYSIVDMRNTEQYSFETFDVNDIVKAYYIDSETGKEKYEFLRIQEVSYNYFFPSSDSSIAVGDKVANEIELFHQIYKKSKNDADTDNNGFISGDDILVEVPDDWGGGLATGNEYFEFIAQKQTETTDAIAGLRAYATETFATIESFTSFQKVTEEGFAASSTRITQVSDELQAQITLEATHFSDTSSSIASIQIQADENGSKISLNADSIELNAKEIKAANLKIKNLESDVATIEQAYITEADVDKLIARYLKTQDANFLTVSAKLIQGGTVNADKLEVNSKQFSPEKITYLINASGGTATRTFLTY